MRDAKAGHDQDPDRLIEEGITEACEQAVRRLEKSPIGLLLVQMESPTREAYTRALHTIFKQAAELAMRLWTQRPYIRCLGYEQLAQTPFRVDSAVMQAHNIHQLDDVEDHRLDERPVSMVLQPAVLRTGTHEAESYDQSRIWAKAVVLVEGGSPGRS